MGLDEAKETFSEEQTMRSALAYLLAATKAYLQSEIDEHDLSDIHGEVEAYHDRLP